MLHYGHTQDEQEAISGNNGQQNAWRRYLGIIPSLSIQWDFEASHTVRKAYGHKTWSHGSLMHAWHVFFQETSPILAISRDLRRLICLSEAYNRIGLGSKAMQVNCWTTHHSDIQYDLRLRSGWSCSNKVFPCKKKMQIASNIRPRAWSMEHEMIRRRVWGLQDKVS